MCGIAGYLRRSGEHDPNRLGSALRVIRHRGPDDSGTAFLDGGDWRAGLGSTRLAIRDLSPAGHMPMPAPDGAGAIVFNGEIYDADQHRREFEAEGVQFRSRSDTEVLLHGLLRYGAAFLDRLDGMYAFAFWDMRRNALLLGRDRFGEKPLFVLDDGSGGLIFASELPALLELTPNRPGIDPEVLHHYLEWGYPSATKSVFSGVRKILAGHWEWHGDQRGAGCLAPLLPDDSIRSVRGRADAGRLVHDALRRSISDRLIADVPVGVFLSGGLDSAGVAALSSSLLGNEHLSTYTVGYPGSEVSELDAARVVARQFRTRHHEIHLTHDFLRALPFVAGALGEPVADPAALPTYFLSTAARQTSTVLLSGEGSDEMFFGYPRYLLHDMADFRFHGGGNGTSLVIAAGSRAIDKVRRARPETDKRDWEWKGLGSHPGEILERSAAHNGLRPCNNGSAASWAREDDLARWLPESVLARVDRMTMAASIEARAPYLAREVARLGMNLSADCLRLFPYGKVALRVALKPYLSLWKRWGKKKPFAVPLVPWMLGPLRPLFDDVFFGERLVQRRWLRQEALREIGTAVARNERKHARLAWAILILELWARVHVDGEAPATPPGPEWKVLEWPRQKRAAA